MFLHHPGRPSSARQQECNYPKQPSAVGWHHLQPVLLGCGGNGIISQGLQHHTSPETTHAPKENIKSVSFGKVRHGLFNPVAFLVLCSLSSWLLWWPILRWALFSGSLAAASSAFHKHVQSCCLIRGINEKGNAMGTCYPVCRPISTSAAMHIIYPDFLEVENFSLVMHRELSHHCTNEQGKTMYGNTVKVAVKIQEAPFLSMTPWWFSD